MKFSAICKGLLSITTVLLTLSLIMTGCSKVEDSTATTSQNENTTTEVTQPQTTDNRSFPGIRPENDQFIMGLDLVKLSNILGIEQEKVEVAFSEAMKSMFGDSPTPFSGNMSGMRPSQNISGQTPSGNMPGMRPSDNFTGGQQSGMPEDGNFTQIPEEVISKVAEILDITTQELEDAIVKTNN